MGTFGYISRRVAHLLFVVWLAGTLNFAIPRLIPGDPVEAAFDAIAISGGHPDVAGLRVSWEKQLGLDQPLVVQYGHYWVNLITLNMGVSVAQYPTPASSLIGAALPWTLGLLGVSTLIAFLIGSLFGALMAWPPSTRFIRFIAPPFLLLSMIPYYLLAIVLISIVAITLGLLPPAGGSSPTLILGWDLESGLDIANHAILPALSIVLGGMGFWALAMRALMVNVLGEDYILFAESKGLSPARIFLRYGMRNAMQPQVTGLAIALGTIMVGAVLVETIFGYPGLGGLLYKSIVAKDIFVINGIVNILILTLAVAVFVIDITLPILDPRTIRDR